MPNASIFPLHLAPPPAHWSGDDQAGQADPHHVTSPGRPRRSHGEVRDDEYDDGQQAGAKEDVRYQDAHLRSHSTKVAIVRRLASLVVTLLSVSNVGVSFGADELFKNIT